MMENVTFRMIILIGATILVGVLIGTLLSELPETQDLIGEYHSKKLQRY